MKKLLLIFVYLSHFISGYADIIIGGTGESQDFGIFTELIHTIFNYQNIEESSKYKKIPDSLNQLLRDLIEFSHFHKKFIPGTTKDINEPFDAFSAVISSSVEDYVKEIGRAQKSSGKDYYIDLIKRSFISTVIDLLILRPVFGSLNEIYNPSDLPPTHLYALILFYRENSDSINKTIEPKVFKLVNFLLNDPATQSLELFQSFLEEKIYSPGDRFKDYIPTHKLNDVEYDERLLEAFASAEKI